MATLGMSAKRRSRKKTARSTERGRQVVLAAAENVKLPAAQKREAPIYFAALSAVTFARIS